MSGPPPISEPPPRLRPFLVGVRLFGVVVALILTRAHQDASGLPAQLKEQYLLITAAVVLYHLVASGISLKASKAMAILLLLLDVGVGVVLTLSAGPAYLLLSYALPVLEANFFFGNLLGIFAAGIGALFFGVLSAYPLVEEAAQNQGQVIFSLQLTAVEVFFSILLLWLFRVAIAEAELRATDVSEARQEKDLLYQQIQSKAQEVGKIYAEVGQRQSMVHQHQARVKELEDALLQAEEELTKVCADLTSSRIATERLQAALEETQSRMSSGMQQETKRLEMQAKTIQRRLDRMTRLMEVFRDLASNLTLNDTLLALTGQLQSLFPCQSCVIFLLDEVDGHRELFPEVAASPFTDIFRNRVLQLGEEAPGWAAQERQAVKIDDTRTSVGTRELTTMVSYERSALVAPLAIPKEVLGAVYLGRTEAGEFTPEDLDLLQEVCNLASIALSNSLDYQRKINRGLHDSVTRLYNGLFLEERMREEVMRGRRYTYPVALILIDLDGFRGIYERLGEDGANHILREVAELLRQATRETDVPARIDGDDFGVLLVHSDRDNAFIIGERIRSSLEQRPFGHGQLKIRVTASIGVAGVPHDATNEEQLHKRASEALQMARSRGGNTTCFWDGSVGRLREGPPAQAR